MPVGWALFGALLGLVAPREALAQSALSGVSLDQHDPTSPGDPFVSVPTASAYGHLLPRGFVSFDYASTPLRLTGGQAIVREQAFVHGALALPLFDRVLLSVSFPLLALQSSDAPTVAGAELTAATAPAPGDLRVGVRARLLGADLDPIQLGLEALAYAPTSAAGPANSFAGENAFRAQPRLLVSGRAGGDVALRYALDGGAMLRTGRGPQTLTYGAALGLSFASDRALVAAELRGATALTGEAPLASPSVSLRGAVDTNLELLGSARVQLVKGLYASAAAGPGLTQAVGTPTYRVVAQLGWADPPAPAAPPAPVDRDDDGIADASDACPTQKGVASPVASQNGCPLADIDGDKVADAEDACPTQKGRASADPARNGCPTDFDQDGIADADDSCPNQKGVASIDPARHGCPGLVDGDLDGVPDQEDACPSVKGVASADLSKNGCPAPPSDRDGDRIADTADACPDEPGVASTEPSRNGCKPLAVLVVKKIEIARQVRFRIDGAALEAAVDPVSEDLLTDVKQVISSNPDLEQIEIQGHADSSGTPDYNQRLSLSRAESVRQWLVTRGVPTGKLRARGFGASKPVATNDTEAGRQANRRVEFVVVRRSK